MIASQTISFPRHARRRALRSGLSRFSGARYVSETCLSVFCLTCLVARGFWGRLAR
ncbi:hypothetical protein ACFPRL_34440 [Pseudoclavibacter helvolus]